MTRHYDPETDDRVVRHLFQCLMSDEQIAARLNVAESDIPPARARMGLGRPKGRQPQVQREEEPVRAGGEQNKPLMAARGALGNRLTEVSGCFRIDGTPTRFTDVMKEANRVLAKQGREQFGPPDWRTP